MAQRGTVWPSNAQAGLLDLPAPEATYLTFCGVATPLREQSLGLGVAEGGGRTTERGRPPEAGDALVSPWTRMNPALSGSRGDPRCSGSRPVEAGCADEFGRWGAS